MHSIDADKDTWWIAAWFREFVPFYLITSPPIHCIQENRPYRIDTSPAIPNHTHKPANNNRSVSRLESKEGRKTWFSIHMGLERRGGRSEDLAD